MNYKLKKAVKNAFAVPIPEEKQKFLGQLNYPKESRAEFLVTQAGYIRKRFWILSFILIITIIIVLRLYPVTLEAVGIISAVLPLLTILSIVEIQRSRSCNMAEIEMSCKHNLVEVVLIRLAAVMSFHLILITILLIFINGSSDLKLYAIICHVTLPFLLCSYLSVYLINRIKALEGIYVCGAVTGFISLCTAVSAGKLYLYEQKYSQIWGMAAAVTVVLFILETVKLIKGTEELQWSLSLTA